MLKKEIKKTLDLVIVAAVSEVKATITAQFADLMTTLKGMLGQPARPTAARDGTTLVSPVSASSSGTKNDRAAAMACDDQAAVEGESSDEAISGTGDDDPTTELDLDAAADDSF